MARVVPQSAGPRVYTTRAGVVVPSVTEVLKVVDRRDFSQWVQRVGRKEANRVSDNAKTLGTKVHTTAQAVAEAYQRGTTVYVLEEMQPYADAVREFLEAHVAEVVHTELSLASDRLRFGGTLDAFVKLRDGSYACVDYKTTASLTRDHGMQLCAYALLLREHGYDVNKRIGVRLRKDEPGRWGMRLYKDHRGDYDGLMGAVALWHWQNASKLKAAEAANGL